jgi:hypothetical protein
MQNECEEKMEDEAIQAGLIWLRIGTGGGLLSLRFP